jgi:hypothetical protein
MEKTILDIVNETMNLQSLGSLTNEQVREIMINNTLAFGDNSDRGVLVTLIHLGYNVSLIEDNNKYSVKRVN